MLTLIIATHGEFGKNLLQAAENLLGPQKAVQALALGANAGREDLLADLKQALDANFSEKGALVLVDLLGGTPFNAALSLIAEKKIEILTGLSLPLLLDALSLRTTMDYQTLAVQLRAKAAGYVLQGSELMRTKEN